MRATVPIFVTGEIFLKAPMFMSLGGRKDYRFARSMLEPKRIWRIVEYYLITIKSMHDIDTYR